MPPRLTSDECKALHARAVTDMKNAVDGKNAKVERVMKKLALALADAAQVLIADETAAAMRLN